MNTFFPVKKSSYHDTPYMPSRTFGLESEPNGIIYSYNGGRMKVLLKTHFHAGSNELPFVSIALKFMEILVNY